MGIVQGQNHGKSVLIVEDDAEIRETLDGLLRVEGYDVITASNGLEALQRLRGGSHADVILLDLMMPVMDGWQFRVQQKRDPELASTPVIAISADSTPKAAAIDADAYLKKPVDYDTLIDTIERTLLTIERKQLQAKLAETDRLTSLGTLAAGVAHEINNPLAYVMANMSFVAQTLPEMLLRALDTSGLERLEGVQAALTPRQARAQGNGAGGDDGAMPDEEPLMDQVLAAVNEARDGCERIRSIVRDLQLFSRPSVEEHAPVDVRKVLDSSINIVVNEVKHRARLVKDYGPVPFVAGNQARLGQIFLNLVLNAAQAIPEGKPGENEVRVVTRTDADGDVVVEVHDTGEGIRPEVRGRIFDPFFTTKPVGVGTGLGLSISHGLVAALGGELTVTSELGKGSVFRVELPAMRAQPRSDAPRVKRAGGIRGKILVVDDEDMICVTLARVLSHAHEVKTTTRAKDALERIRSGEQFDLILCDLMMPELSGMDVYEEVKRIAPAQAERMVFLTGGAFTAKAQAFVASVKNSFVEKPFDVAALLELIQARIEPRARA
jgi:signal transduction histidine kinase